jgi:hypothetical protein
MLKLITCPDCREKVEHGHVCPVRAAFEAWCDTPMGQRCQHGQAYGPYLKMRLLEAFNAGRGSK